MDAKLSQAGESPFAIAKADALDGHARMADKSAVVLCRSGGKRRLRTNSPLNSVSGMDVVDKIAAVPRGGVGPMPGAAPLTPIVIEKVKVVP